MDNLPKKTLKQILQLFYSSILDTDKCMETRNDSGSSKIEIRDFPKQSFQKISIISSDY